MAQAKLQLATKLYDQIFEENYGHLTGLALKITNYDHDLSQDLLHDLYLKLSQLQADESPQNPMAYMFIALRNSYQSVIRKKRLGESLLSYDEELLLNTLYDDKALNLPAIEGQLLAICKYACLRKATSLSGSVIILRYFHGYFGNEVSRIIRRSRNAVEARLVTARREINQYLANPQTVPYVLTPMFEQTHQINQSKSARSLLAELRRQIFSTRQGDCLSDKEYQLIYHLGKRPPNKAVLSHIVSCERCLDHINGLLKLPKLSARHPLDSIRQST